MEASRAEVVLRPGARDTAATRAPAASKPAAGEEAAEPEDKEALPEAEAATRMPVPTALYQRSARGRMSPVASARASAASAA